MGKDYAMRFLRPALTALLMGVATPALVAAPSLAQTCACPPSEASFSGPVIQAEEPPPPLPVYEQPPLPAPGYIWTPGYWAWNNYDYYWVPGVWVPPPQPGFLWTPGYWAFVGGAYLFHAGYWGPHVGFYGGVDYGFGYNGLGYEGGRWEASRFVYNTAVNNFGGVRVANVYTQNVTAAPGAGRASYNGGPGGVVLRPTPEQERLTTEDHVRPTQLQVSQARTASMEAMQFHSANQGKPAVAATARPGDLKGPGVVPAKAAGSAALTPATAPNAAPAPNVEQKLAPGIKPPAGAPGPEHQLPSGATLPGGAQPGAPGTAPRANLGEKPPAGAPNLERRPPNIATPPAGASPGAPVQAPRANLGARPPAPAETGPAPRLNNAAPINAPSPQQQRAPVGPPRPEGASRPEMQRPGPAAMAPAGEHPRVQFAPGGPQMGPPGAAERRPQQRPQGQERECGKPGQPPCR
jgi:hypothetical protein